MAKSIVYTVFKGTNREFVGSIKDISIHFNINENTLRGRIKRGYSLEEAIDWDGGKINGSIKHTVFKGTNREFTGDYSEIAKYFDINYAALKSRIHKGYLLEDAIDWDGGKFEKYTVFKGTDREFTGNYSEIAKHFNINYTTLKGRLETGYSFEEAIDWDGGNCDLRPKIIFKGTDREFTGNLKEIAKHFNIDEEILYGRLKRGYSIEEAIDWDGGNGPGSIKYTVFKDTDREFTGNKIEIAEHFNIKYSNFRQKIRNGFSIEEAINIPLTHVRANNLEYKNFKGSLRELCKHFNKNYIEVYNKLKFNHTLEWAIESTEKEYEDN